MSAYLFQNLYKVLGIRSAHPKGRYVSWVKNDVNQFGLYLFPQITCRIYVVLMLSTQGPGKTSKAP